MFQKAKHAIRLAAKLAVNPAFQQAAHALVDSVLSERFGGTSSLEFKTTPGSTTDRPRTRAEQEALRY